MSFDPSRINGFALQGTLFRSWKSVCDAIEQEIDERDPALREADGTKFATHLKKLQDSETMVAFGYIARAEEKTGKPEIMQSTIVNKLVPESSDGYQEERRKVRQSIARRARALEFFGLINRYELSQVAVQFSLSENGKMYGNLFNGKVRAALLGEGETTCLAAE